MLGLVSVYNTDEHTIVRGELSRWLERLVEGDPQRGGSSFPYSLQQTQSLLYLRVD